MNSYRTTDMTWELRVAREGAFSAREWIEFFGDEYNWTSLLPLAWAAVAGPSSRVKPPKLGGEQEIFRLASWWNTPLHLLGYGLGWTHIGKGLTNWREEGYSVENDILRFVFNTYGPSIEALEYWLNSSDGAYEIHQTLFEVGGGKVTSRDFTPSAQTFRRQQDDFIASLSSGPRHRLGESFITGGGYDPLHLTGHFLGALGIWQEGGRPTTPAAISESGDFELLRLETYRGWMISLAARFQVSGWLENTNPRKVIQVEISGLGVLGTFAYCEQTGRPYRLSATENLLPNTQSERDWQLRWHMLGN